MKSVTAYSPGRVVLSGEHSVIYGQPAVVASINLGTNIEITQGKINGLSKNEYFMTFLNFFEKKTGQDFSNLDFKINSNLPPKTGLASSSALAHALIKALAKYFDIKFTQDELFNLVLEAERQIFPVSGMDQAAVVYSGLRQIKNPKLSAKGRLAIGWKNKSFLLINSGEAVESTAEMVAKIKNSKSKFKNTIIKKIGNITQQLINDLETDVFNPKLIFQNQRLLEELGVVGEKAKSMIREIENIAAVAKITGAGGVKNGSGMLLCYHEDFEKLENLAKNKNWEYYQISI